MKKTFLLKLFTAIMLICLSLTALTACEDVQVQVTFMVDDEVHAVVNLQDGDTVEMPEDPIPPEGYSFGGWYLDKDTWQIPFMGKVEDTTVFILKVYARWIEGDAQCNHVWSQWTVGVEPTCSAEGKQGRYCLRCSKTEVESIEKSAHTEEIIPGISSTCISAGLTEGKKCSVCGEILTEQTTAPTSDHDWDITTLEYPSCLNGGKEKRVCKTCDAIEYFDIAPLGHELIYTISGSAESGDLSVSFNCSRCSHSGTCDDVTSAEIIANSTCNEYGSAILTYADGRTETVMLVKLTGKHVFNGKEIDLNETLCYDDYEDVLIVIGGQKPTCAYYEGDCAFQCENCYNFFLIEVKANHTIPSDFDYSDENNYKAPAPAESGFIKYTCVVCAEPILEELSPCEHDLLYTISGSAENNDLAVSFNCLKRACVYSGTCDNVASAEVKESVMCDEYGSATLTYLNGTTETVKLAKGKTHSLCGDKITSGQQLDYYYSKYRGYIHLNDGSALCGGDTCDATFTCELCKSTVSVIAKGEHELIYTISGSAENNDLSVSFKCSHCSYSGTCDNVANAEITQNPICGEYGSAILTYSDGRTETVKLAESTCDKHVLNGKVIDLNETICYNDYDGLMCLGGQKPDCRNAYSCIFMCENCKSYYTINAKGNHKMPSDFDYSDDTYKAPTSTEKGFIKYNCSVCNEPIQEEIPTHSHDIKCQSVKTVDGNRYLVITCIAEDCLLNVKAEYVIQNKTAYLYKNCVIDVTDVLYAENDSVIIDSEQAALKGLTVEHLYYDCYKVTITSDSVLQYLHIDEEITLTVKFSA